jgi:hypothetical protein
MIGTEPAPETGPLELQVRAPADPVPVGEPVEVAVVVVNRDSVPIFVNRRLLVAPPETPKPFREVTFEVREPPGYVNRKVVQVNSGRPRPADFVDLAPGASIEKPFELTRFHSMHVPGTYSVRATYANTVDLDDLEQRPWIGSITSGWSVVRRV